MISEAEMIQEEKKTNNSSLETSQNQEKIRKQKRSKKIRKFFQQHNSLKLSFQQVEYKISLRTMVPHTQKSYRSEFDLCLILDDLDSSGFGELPQSQFSFFSNIQKIIKPKDDQIIQLQLDNKAMSKTPLNQIIEQLKSYNDQEKLRTSNILRKMREFHLNPSIEKINSLEELFEQSKNNFFLGFVSDVYEDQSKISSFYINKNLLQFMGVTNDMYIDFSQNENLIPDPLNKEKYLVLWNNIMESTINQQTDLDVYLKTYEGYNIPFTLTIKLGYLQNEVTNLTQIIQTWNFTAKNNIQWLLNLERIENNQNQYYGQKKVLNQNRFQQFQQDLGLITQKKVGKRCHFVEKS